MILCVATFIDITAFFQNPNGVLVPDTRVSFTCQAMVLDVHWIVDRVRIDNATANSAFQIMTSHFSQNSTTISILLTQAKSDGNNTNITCVATDFESNIIDSRTMITVLAGEF